MFPQSQETLLSRSPRSRKSLAVTGAGSAIPIAKRKRAHSIAPGEKLKLDAARRRSLLRPSKGILKPSNQSDQTQETTQDISQAYQIIPHIINPDDTDITPNGGDNITSEFRIDVQDNPSRKSLGGRRVSFAAHAHVRVFESAEPNTNGSSSPASSLSPSSSVSAHSDPTNISPSHPSPEIPSPSGRASIDLRSHSSLHRFQGDGGGGEESMDVSADEIPPHRIILPKPPQSPLIGSVPPGGINLDDDDDDEREDEDMSMTGEFEPDIISRRRSLSLATGDRRKSRMRSSIAIPRSEGGVEPKDFTVSVDRPPPPESDAFKALMAIANSSRADDNPGDVSKDGEVDMDVTTAVTRLIAVRNSTGGQFQATDSRDDSFTSTDESFDGVDVGDCTMNVTNLIEGVRVSDYGMDDGDLTMSVTSVLSDPTPVLAPDSAPSAAPLPSQPKPFVPAPSARSVPLPVFKQSGAVLQPGLISRRVPSPSKGTSSTSSPVKQPIKQFTAAFAPPYQPPKRLLTPSGPNSTTSRPNKKRALTISESSVALPSPTRRSPAPGSPAVKARCGPQRVPDLVPLVDVVGDVVGDDGLERDPEGDQEGKTTLDSAPTQSIDFGQWASGIHSEGEDVPQDHEMAPISVDQFFTMTGIRFMDDLTCPRRSTVHPSQLQRRESNENEHETYTLSEYAVAMTVDVAQLETMTWIANDIRSAIEKYKAQYRQTEDDAAKDMPFLFREYTTASEEDREQILYVLKLIKAHTILSAKASWYEWKRGWVQGLQGNAERALDNLYADERQLAAIATRAAQSLPNLKMEYEEIVRDLEHDKAAVAEIENCDQTFLAELKATIAEQRQQLDLYRNDIADGKAKLGRLEETLQDLDDQAHEARSAITTAQRQMDMQKSNRRADVFRLRDELSSLQDLHLWRATQLSAELVEFVYDSKYKVTVPCRRFWPITEAFEVSAFDRAGGTDDFPLVTELMYRIARRNAIQGQGNKVTLRMILQRLTDFWASYAQLRWQLSFIMIKYPLALELLPLGSRVDDAEGFKATATLLLCKKASKALINFYFDGKILSGWPTALGSLNYDVSVVYGRADPKVVGDALKTRLAEATAVENHACLVDACMEVVSRYS